MKSFKASEMIGGWFVGAFNPAVLNTSACEVAVKNYSKGQYESKHFHKIATEVTYIISGEVMMCGKQWGPGDIIVLTPGDITDFEALTDTVNVVVKLPGALGDKYIA
ncbi:cupin domain-containing protein [Rahnella sp. PD12R]|uniref:cupin domain-containing protein n=1 Tax=Rahnella sp. PD12R TaxID=2855688 RepID=UPI001C465ACD|nr:cupin domain-containing protein [Rahnella sp. PD12R]MBV6819534.1 cupin domain-containing protein [Rahnella sp. PD12R]